MNKTLLVIIIFAGVAVTALLVGVGWYFSKNTNPPTQPTVTNSTTSGSIPSNNTVTTGSVPTPGTTQTALSVQGINGATIAIKDFIHASSTVVDPNNQGQYFLNNTGKQKSVVPYNILYVAADQSFTIALLQEPIGDSRRQAESALQNSLGISESDMCNLRYRVLVSHSVNSYYSGKNLGFSFCPDAIAF